MNRTEQYVKASDHSEVVGELREAKERLATLSRETREAEQRGYENGRTDERAALTRNGSVSRSYAVRPDEAKGEDDSGIAYLTLPDNGGSIQFHVTGEQGPSARENLGGLISCRVWGPPDERGFGVHEQGGGNLTDLFLLFGLDERGIDIQVLDLHRRRA